MTLTPILTYGIPAIIGLVVLLVLGAVVARMYTKATTELAFVRTGGRTRKVVINSGAFVFPLIHSIMWVNLQSLKLSVQRAGKQSLVTGDHLRADVDVDFHVRVTATAEAVAQAAQTLGSRTLKPEAMRDQIEPKLVGELRAVAAKMTLSELHQRRDDFVRQVREAVAPVLEANGLYLESVSVTSLNQTEKRFFDIDNVLDAQGLAIMTETIEASRKRINDVEQTNAVAIEQRNLLATRERATIQREATDVELANRQEIARMTAEREAAIAATTAEGDRLQKEAALRAERDVALQRTRTQQEMRDAQVEADRVSRERQIAAETAVRLSQQEQAISVAQRSEQEAAAMTSANEARVKAVQSEELVETARAVELANRAKAVAVVAAQQRAEEDSIGVVVSARAEQEAAEARAATLLAIAAADRDAAKLRAEGTLADGEARANVERQLNEAANLVSPEVLQMRMRMAFIEILPAAIRESVAPMQKIDSIRIAQVGGLGGSGNGNGSFGTTGSATADPMGNVVNAALAYRTQRPVIDSVLSEVLGVPGTSLETLLNSSAIGAGVTAADTVVSAEVASPSKVEAPVVEATAPELAAPQIAPIEQVDGQASRRNRSR